jgi:hypothetical protein
MSFFLNASFFYIYFFGGWKMFGVWGLFGVVQKVQEV